MTTPTQSQIRDAQKFFSGMEQMALKALAQHGMKQPDNDKQCFATVAALLQSALDTQKPAGDAVEALGTLYREAARMGEYYGSGLIKDAYATVKAALTGDCGGGDLAAYILDPALPDFIRDLDIIETCCEENLRILRIKNFIKKLREKALTADNAKRGE